MCSPVYLDREDLTSGYSKKILEFKYPSKSKVAFVTKTEFNISKHELTTAMQYYLKENYNSSN